MEGYEKKLLEEYVKKDQNLKNLLDEHGRLEKRLAKLSKKKLLTTEEEEEEKKLKKVKLLGRDRIFQILREHSKESLVLR